MLILGHSHQAKSLNEKTFAMIFAKMRQIFRRGRVSLDVNSPNSKRNDYSHEVYHRH